MYTYINVYTCKNATNHICTEEKERERAREKVSVREREIKIVMEKKKR